MSPDPAAHKREEAPGKAPHETNDRSQRSAGGVGWQAGDGELGFGMLSDLLHLLRAERRDRRLARIYKAPDVFQSAADAERAACRDLAELSREALWLEAERVKARLVAEARASAWLLRRLAACRAEAERRRAAR